MFTAMHNAKAGKGHLVGCSFYNLMVFVGNEWTRAVMRFPSHGFIFCITGFPLMLLLLWWTMGASECPRFIIVFQNVNLWISKFNFATTKFLYICPHTIVSVPEHAPRNMFLSSWKTVEVWFTSKYSPWLWCRQKG